MSLYERGLLALAREPLAPLPTAPTHRATLDNPLCGDSVELGLRLEGGLVTELGFSLEACAICAAGAGWLHRRLQGEPLERFQPALAELEAAVRGESPKEAALFVGLADHPSRHGCALLPWRAFERALLPGPRRDTPATPVPLLGTDAFAVARTLEARGEPFAVATLVSVVGSSPCPIGSRMVITTSGAFWGSVSGGCVESAVVQAGLRALEGAEPALLTYQISNSAAGEVGLPCGGQVRVHVARGTVPAPGEVRVLELATGALRTLTRSEAPPRALPEAERSDHGVLTDDETYFVEPVVAPRRLVLVGGTHVAQELAGLARAVGFEPVLVEPRAALGSPARFPSVERIARRPGDALPRLLDRRSAVVMLTHDPRLDDPAIRAALASDAFYVAALGSRKTQRARLDRLRAAGVSDEQLARLRGPAGLPIGAVGAAEIALSILAEIVATMRAPSQPPDIAALVLAAGSSTRAGERNKLLLEVEGEPMIRRVVRTIVDAGVARCLVVLGHEADRVREALRGLDVALVMNDIHAEGMGSSIACGMRALGTSPDAVLLALGDMPFVRESDVRRVLAAHSPSTAHLVIAPEAGEGADARRGHPVLWPRRYFGALAALEGDEGGRSILRDAPGALLTVATPGNGVLRDIDHPDDLREA